MKLSAEADCRHTHKSPWSPLLERLRSEVLYWNSWFRQPTSRTDGSSYRARICPHLPVLTAPSYNFINTSLREAQAKFKLASASSTALRTQHMIDLAKLYSHTNRASESSIVRQILWCETRKTIFRRLKITLRKPVPRAVTEVIVNTPGGSKTTIIDKHPMEEAFTAHNLRHFSQADGTPFTAHPIISTYGPYGTNSPSRRLLQGHIPPNLLSEATYTIINNLPLPDVPTIDDTMYLEEIMQAYSIWRESTSTSPHGDHLGHDKAILRKTRTIAVDDDPTQQLDHRMFSIRTHLLNLALKHGMDRLRTVAERRQRHDRKRPR